jgi:hypothetical protein
MALPLQMAYYQFLICVNPVHLRFLGLLNAVGVITTYLISAQPLTGMANGKHRAAQRPPKHRAAKPLKIRSFVRTKTGYEFSQ